MKKSTYTQKIKQLHGELVAMQEWVKHTGAKVCIVFEGRDTAGKGGVIKALTERVSPRVFKVHALPAPNEREKTQMYIQRYANLLPAAGEITIFDRSWYNRCGVERVMGFANKEQVEKFLRLAPFFEKMVVESGVILLKYWLEVSPQEQERRLKARMQDVRKTWKLSPMDLKSYEKWDEYSAARDDMFRRTHVDHAPWHVAKSDDKKSARIAIIDHILKSVPYAKLDFKSVKLPKRTISSKLDLDATIFGLKVLN